MMNPFKRLNEMFGAKYVEGVVLNDVAGQREVCKKNSYIKRYVNGLPNPKWIISKKEYYELDLASGYKQGGKPRIFFAYGMSKPLGFIAQDKTTLTDKSKDLFVMLDDKMMQYSLTPPKKSDILPWIICIGVVCAFAFIMVFQPQIAQLMAGNSTATSPPPTIRP